MNFKTKAVVLQQKPYLDNQKYLNILTTKNGILNVKLRLYGQVTKSIFSNIYVSGFYEFNLFSGRYGIVVDSVEEIEQFFKLRFFPDKFALSQYFCELSYILGLPLQNSSKSLKLLLNSLWFLEKGDMPTSLIKAVFELKMLSYSGYMLNLVCCKFCCSYEKEKMYINPFKGFLVCEDCLKTQNNGRLILLTKAVLYAMRFTIYKGQKHIFKFSLETKQLNFFSKIAEIVVLAFIEKEPLTLKIYKQFNEEFKI